MELPRYQVNDSPESTVSYGELFVFLCNKRACDLMARHDLMLGGDDESNASLERMMSTVILRGVRLAQAQATTQEHFDAETAALVETAPDFIRETISQMCPILLPVGVNFYHEIIDGTPRVKTWMDEFNILDQARL